MEILVFDWLMKEFINLQRTKVYVFSDSVLCLGKIHENLSIKRLHGKTD